MDRAEFVAILTPLLIAHRTEFDQAAWTVYHRALGEVPAAVLSHAVDALVPEAREFFPKTGELRAACERQRRALLAAHPYEGCADCEHSRGWTTVLVDGVPRAAACACRGRHRAKLEALGLAEPVAALPGEAGAGESAEYPSLEQLPSGVRVQVTAIAGRKVLR